MERSGALEFSRYDDSGNCLLKLEYSNCLLRVLLECDDDRLSRLRIRESTEFDWLHEANSVEGLRASCETLAAATVGA